MSVAPEDGVIAASPPPTAPAPVVLPSLPLTGGRRTIARAVALDGIGLHLGRRCRLVFRPAAPRAGVFFRRLDLPDAPIVPALVGVAVEAERRTQLGVGEAALHTVEHVLAAVGALGIDDLEIGLDAPEPPIMDGSAAPFLSALAEAGLVSNGGSAEWLVLRRSLRVVDGDSVYEAEPSLGLDLEVGIAFPHPLIGTQVGKYHVTPETFARELAGARTFGFLHEVDEIGRAHV